MLFRDFVAPPVSDEPMASDCEEHVRQKSVGHCLSLELEGTSAGATCSVLQNCIAKHESTFTYLQLDIG